MKVRKIEVKDNWMWKQFKVGEIKGGNNWRYKITKNKDKRRLEGAMGLLPDLIFIFKS